MAVERCRQASIETPELAHGDAEGIEMRVDQLGLHAQPGRWDFLTGSKTAIYDLSQKGFKLGVADGSDEMGMPVHSTRMVLVDRKDLPSAGAGETPIVTIAPAIGNALFDATGQRLRALPMLPNGLKG